VRVAFCSWSILLHPETSKPPPTTMAPGHTGAKPCGCSLNGDEVTAFRLVSGGAQVEESPGGAGNMLWQMQPVSHVVRPLAGHHRAGGLGLLHREGGDSLPGPRRSLLALGPAAEEPPPAHRRYSRGGVEAHPLLVGGRRRCGRDFLPALRQEADLPDDRAPGGAHTRHPALVERCGLQPLRLHHRPRERDAGTGGRPPPARRGRERDPRLQVRARAQPHAERQVRSQRGLAGDSQ